MSRLWIRRVAFYALEALVLAAILFLLNEAFTWIFTGWYPLFTRTEPGPHQFHIIAFSSLVWMTIAGLLVQAWRPERQAGGMLQAVVATAAPALAALLTADLGPDLLMFLACMLILAIAHPAGLAVLRRTDRLGRGQMTLVGIATIPMLVFAAGQIGLQALHIPGDEHAMFGHWRNTGVLLPTVLLLGLIASLKPAGWRVPAWTAGVAAAIFGLASVAYPVAASSAGLVWGSLAVLWGVAFIAESEREFRSRRAAAAFGMGLPVPNKAAATT
jgi:hypothetical protein